MADPTIAIAEDHRVSEAFTHSTPPLVNMQRKNQKEQPGLLCRHPRYHKSTVLSQMHWHNSYIPAYLHETLAY